MLMKVLIPALCASVTVAEAGIFPPGIANSASAALDQANDWELDLQPPTDNAGDMSRLQTLANASNAKATADGLAARQRLLNAEISDIQKLVGGSFLQTGSDFQLNLHPHAETAAEIKAGADGILAAESARQNSEAANFAADKRRILAAGLAQMRGLGKSSFLMPLVPPVLATQSSWQAAMPSEVHVNFDTPMSSFLKTKDATDVYYDAAPSASQTESSYQQVLNGMKSAISADFASMTGSSFLQTKQVNIAVASDAGGRHIDADRLRADLRAFADRKIDGYFGNSSFLKIAGDDVPNAADTLNIWVNQGK